MRIKRVNWNISLTCLRVNSPCADSELKICHISKTTGTCEGDEDVVILCEKVQKGVKIKFFETDGIKTLWEEYASFSTSDIHHQVAIKFKTPKYYINTENEKTVYVCLEQGDKRSESVEFTYLPQDNSPKRKKCDKSQKGRTIDLLSYTMDISSPSCASEEFLDDILREQPKGLLESLEDILKSDENSSDSFIMQDVESPSSVLNPELKKNFQLASLMNLLPEIVDDAIERSADEVEQHTVNQSRIFSPDPDFMGMIDGNLTSEMALICIEDSKIPKEVSKKELEKKMLKDKYKNLEKFLPILSNTDGNGNSLLHLAVKYNKDVKKVLYLNKISESKIIHVKNNHGQTALHIAVEMNSDTVVVLLKNMADPNIKNADGNNCYHIACQHDFVKSLMHISNEGCCNAQGLNDFNREGLTPLHIALKNYSPSCLDFILKEYRDLIDFSLVESHFGKSLLHYAVEYSPTYILPLLKEKKIDINAKDYQRRTPLFIAERKGNFDIVSQLLSAGARPDKWIPKYISSVRDAKQAAMRKREASVGQSCLHKASTGPSDGNGSTEDKESTRIFEELAKNLSVLLDPDMKWKELATYELDEEYIGSLVECPSPTRAILEYMKKHHGAQYIEHLRTVFCLIGCTDAVTVISASCQP